MTASTVKLKIHYYYSYHFASKWKFKVTAFLTHHVFPIKLTQHWKNPYSKCIVNENKLAYKSTII